MKTTTTTIAAALLAVLASHGQEERPGPPHGRPPHPPMPLILALDADKDRLISADEIANAATVLQELDEDEDGSVTRRELRPKPPEEAAGEGEGAPEDVPGAEGGAPPPPQGEGGPGKHRGPRRPAAPPLFAVLDTDRDGNLSAEEIEAAPENLSQLDRDGDGSLSPREFHPGPPRGPRDEEE